MPDYVRQTELPGTTTRRPQFVYESRGSCPLIDIWALDRAIPEDCDRLICQVVSNVNESTIWCEDCTMYSAGPTQLHKSFQAQGTSFARVWHDPGVPHPATGKPVSGMRDLREQLHRASGEMEDRLGMTVNYEPIDLTERDALGITDEGMDSTHDVAVKEGRKDSRGRFVW